MSGNIFQRNENSLLFKQLYNIVSYPWLRGASIYFLFYDITKKTIGIPVKLTCYKAFSLFIITRNSSVIFEYRTDDPKEMSVAPSIVSHLN